MTKLLPDELLAQEIERRFGAFGPARDEEHSRSRAESVRKGLEPAWNEVQARGPAWARGVVTRMVAESRMALAGAREHSSQAGYGLKDLKAVLAYLDEDYP